MIAATSGQPVFDDHDLGDSSLSSAVQAAVDWYGPVDFKTIDAQYGHRDQKKRMMERLAADYLGAPIALVPDLVRASAPRTYVTPSVPPMLIEHGDQDSLVPVEQSRELASWIEQVAGPGRVQLVILNTAEHSDPVFGGEENLHRVFSFLDRTLQHSGFEVTPAHALP